MDPMVIQRQMLMQQFTMVKFFMSALSTSMHVSIIITSGLLQLAELAVVTAVALVCQHFGLVAIVKLMVINSARVASPDISSESVSMLHLALNKVLPKPKAHGWCQSPVPQPDTSLDCENMDTWLVHCAACLFRPQLLLVLILIVLTREGMIRLS